ncbi:hypothetical protein RJ55_02908 [Drechmeria coniospora]|nr:hypothetical protein RJ55_02908 [Drechmeria coniospora]
MSASRLRRLAVRSTIEFPGRTSEKHPFIVAAWHGQTLRRGSSMYCACIRYGAHCAVHVVVHGTGEFLITCWWEPAADEQGTAAPGWLPLRAALTKGQW